MHAFDGQTIAYNSAVKMLAVSASLKVLVISLERAAEDTLLSSFEPSV